MKNVYKVLAIFTLAIILRFDIPVLKGQASTEWLALETAGDVYRAYPTRMEQLLQAINMDLPELSKVKEAYQNGYFVQACNHLLDYYRDGETVAYFRQDLPQASSAKLPNAENLLANIFSFYGQTDQVPLVAGEHLNWFDQGPADDKEWAFELNRQDYLVYIMRAYLKTGNSVYVKKIDRLIKDWIVSSLPYPEVKSSTAMWRSLEVSSRLQSWSRVFYGLIKSKHFSPATQLLLLSSIPEHTHYLLNFHGGGNWLTSDMTALARAATAWPEFKLSGEWLNYSIDTMVASIQDQVYPDGVQTELASSYHYGALEDFSAFYEIAQQVGIELPVAYVDQIENMWNYLAYVVRPSGTNPLNNDSDLINFRQRIYTAAAHYERSDWQFIMTDGQEGTQPAETSVVFPYAGQVVQRSAWEEKAQWLFFDIGPWGTGHQHNDKLHISLSAYGRDLLVDSGRFAYKGSMADKFRDYALGSEGHNVLLIDGQGQSEDEMRTFQPINQSEYYLTKDLDYARGKTSRFQHLEGEAEHIRSVTYIKKKFWIVVDHIRTDRPRYIEALWHWHPESKVSAKEDVSVGTDNEFGNLQVVPVEFKDWQIQLVKGREDPAPQGWYSEVYNQAVPNVTSVFQTNIERDTYFVWLLLPSEHTPPAVKAQIVAQDDSGFEIKVKMEEGVWEVRVPNYDAAAASYSFQPLGDDSGSVDDGGPGDQDFGNSDGTPSVFPNPTSGVVWVTGVDLAKAYLKVYDQYGQAVIQRKMEDNRIDLSGMKGGMYVIQVDVEGSEGIRKTIVKLD